MSDPQENRGRRHDEGGIGPRRWPSPGKRGFSAFGAALTLAWLLALTGPPSHIATVRAAQAGSEETFFTEMMPVFTSPRCLGCHGQVNPSQGTGHEGGKVDVAFDDSGDMAKGTKEEKACLECHTAANQWRTAPGALSFVGKDAPALCAQIKRVNGLGGTNAAAQRTFLAHLSTDYFIGLAFVGKRAVGDTSPFGPLAAERPGMSRPEFVAAARRWLGEGRAACGSLWNGTIERSTNWEKLDPISQDGTVRTIATRQSNVTITVTDGVATATAWYISNLEVDDPRYKRGSGAVNCHYQGNNENVETRDPVPATVLITALQGRASIVFNVNGKMEGTNFGVQRVFPACSDVKTETPMTQEIPGGYADGPVDPKNPTEVIGTKPIKEPDGSTTEIKWKLTLTKD